MRPLCAITGATGHIGYRLAEILLERGAQVRVIARNQKKLQPLVEKGAQAFVGDLEDVGFLTRAFSGADGVFAMIPPNLQAGDLRAFQNRVGETLVAAIEAAQVGHVVNLSSQGARLAAGIGPIAALHDQEERLNRLAKISVVHLRAAFFMENLQANLKQIRKKGILVTPLPGDLMLPVIATCDIARVAADYLATLNFSGKSVRDLLGQRDLSMFEMTRILGKALGNPGLRYTRAPYETAKEALLQMGASPDVARLLIEMYQAFNDGPLMKGLERTPENTTETPFEVFVKGIAAKKFGE